jgi:hypothetical protein
MQDRTAWPTDEDRRQNLRHCLLEHAAKRDQHRSLMQMHAAAVLRMEKMLAGLDGSARAVVAEPTDAR